MKPSAGRALRHRNYRLFFGGQFLSLIGTLMQQVAQQWLVYRLTGSGVLLGLVGLCAQMPVVVLGPFCGVVADRLPRRRILVATQTVAMLLAFALAALAFTGRVSVTHIVLLATLLGLVNAVNNPAQQAFVVEMVGKEDLPNALALNASILTAGRVVGPAIAGLVIAAVGEGWCFVFNGVSFVAVIVALFAMRDLLPAPPARGGSVIGQITEGFRFVASEGPVAALMLNIAVVGLAESYLELMPLFADRILHGGPRALGILVAASSAGALAGALTLTGRLKLAGLDRWVAIATATFGLTLLVFAVSRTFWLSVAIFVPFGFSFMVAMTATMTLLQAMSPDRLRGRVMANYGMVFNGMIMLGGVIAGGLADRLGPATAVGSFAAASVVAAGLLGWQAFEPAKPRGGALGVERACEAGVVGLEGVFSTRREIFASSKKTLPRTISRVALFNLKF